MGFIKRFEEEVNNIPLEPVYSGKNVIWIVRADYKKGFFSPQNWRIIIIHGGGLQGEQRVPVKYPN